MAIISAEDLGLKFGLNGQKKSLRSFIQSGFKKDKDVKDFWALRHLKFEVEQGEILGVIGNNGSGKSTLLRMIAGIYMPDEGKLEVNGTISPLLSLGTGFRNEFDGVENVYMNGILMGFTKKEIEKQMDDIVHFSEIGDFIHEPIKNYSSGMKARLGFSIAVHLKRDIMLIDEVLGVGDFRFRDKSQEKLQEVIAEGRTVVIVSHDLASIAKYSTKAMWLHRGVQRTIGDPAYVIKKYKTTKKY